MVELEVISGVLGEKVRDRGRSLHVCMEEESFTMRSVKRWSWWGTSIFGHAQKSG